MSQREVATRKEWQNVAAGMLQLVFFLGASALSLYVLWGGQLLVYLVSYYDTTRDMLRYFIFVPILSVGLRYVERTTRVKLFATNRPWTLLTVLFSITAVTWHALMVQNAWYWDLDLGQAGRGVILVHFFFSIAFTSILLNYEMPTTFRRRAALTIAIVVSGLLAYDNWENLRHLASIGRPAADLWNSMADPAAAILGSVATIFSYERIVKRRQLLSRVFPVKVVPSVDKTKTVMP